MLGRARLRHHQVVEVRYAIWCAEWAGPEIYVVEATDPKSAYLSLSPGRDPVDLEADWKFMEQEGWSPGWHHGDDSVIEIGTVEQVAGLARDLLCWAGPDYERDYVERKWWPTERLGPMPAVSS